MSSKQVEQVSAGENDSDHHDGSGKSTPDAIPELNGTEREKVESRIALSAAVVHEAVREEGQRELSRSSLALAWSGLAAGLSMGFSLVAKGLFDAYLPDALWRPLLDNFGYSVGFLTSRAVQQPFLHVSQQSVTGAFGITLVKAIFAGWLIALMVWLLPAAEGTRLQVIIIITYLVGLGEFSHIIAGSVDAFYLVNLGKLSWLVCFGSFIIPMLIGNVTGGVSLVAVLNYAQVASETVGK